jgi:uncharacterized membrane protein
MSDDVPQVTQQEEEATQTAPPAEPTTGNGAAPLAPAQKDSADEPVVEMTPEATPEASAAPAPERALVHVAPNLLEVATGRAETTEEKHAVKEVRDLNEVVHSMLIVGLIISTTLMLIGIIEGIVLGHAMPTVEPDLGQVLAAVRALRPSGFMGLGLLVLLATPILRVIGSIFAFMYERDWRFAGVTLLVFLIVMTSILLGRG